MPLFNLFNFDFHITPQIRWPFFRKVPSRESANILFIDDSDCPVVQNLRKAGWAVNKINDVTNIHIPEILHANIIFVDYKGVGGRLSERDQGLAVIRAIKNEYGTSKRVILYSAYGHFKLSMDMRVADNQLSKSSETSEFISMIESELKKIR